MAWPERRRRGQPQCGQCKRREVDFECTPAGATRNVLSATLRHTIVATDFSVAFARTPRQCKKKKDARSWLQIPPEKTTEGVGCCGKRRRSLHGLREAALGLSVMFRARPNQRSTSVGRKKISAVVRTGDKLASGPVEGGPQQIRRRTCETTRHQNAIRVGRNATNLSGIQAATIHGREWRSRKLKKKKRAKHRFDKVGMGHC